MRHLNAPRADKNFPSSQSDAILKSSGGLLGLPSVRNSCLPVRPTKNGAIGGASFSKIGTPKRNGSCFLPLTPRCGVAKVIKLTASSPAIVPRLEGRDVCKFPSEESVTLSDWVPLIFILTHLFSVLELLQNQTVGDAPKKNTKKFDDQNLVLGDVPKKNGKKFDHLVLGPAAGEGLPNRLQCQGVKALNKPYFSNPSHASGVGDGIAFVTVFTIYNNSPDSLVNSRSSNLVTVGNASYSKLDRSMAILNTFINFIQVRMPQSNVIILTDPESDLSVHRNRVTVHPIQGEYSRDKLMLQRIRSYITFLEARLEKLSQEQGRITHFIFTDSDIAVIDDLGQIFDKYQNFHLALTFRNNKDQPLNSGFIAVQGTHDGILRAIHFLQKVFEVYSSRYMKASRMLGDQLALAWVVKSHPSFDAKRFSKAQAFTEDIDGASVLFLPCAMYNWTPPEGAGQFHGMPLDVKVVHFKGSRKRLMLEAWNFLSSSADISDMLCLILKSGRTKYDF